MSDLVEVARYSTRVEADLARLYLEDGGVAGVLFDADMHGWGPIPVRLMVLDEELVAALLLLRDYTP